MEEILQGIRQLKDRAKNLVVVTNEVFSDGISYDPDTMRYLFIGKHQSGDGEDGSRSRKLCMGFRFL